jgi:hypothetical protein
MRRMMFVTVIALAINAGAAAAAPLNDGSTKASAKLSRLVTTVPVATFNQVGTGKLAGRSEFGIFKLHGAPLRVDGKPGVVSGALAWCPHCAVDNWSLAIALGRFGTLTGLRVVDTGTYYAKTFRRSGGPFYSNTIGLDFLRAHYSSPYLGLSSFVLQDVNGHHVQSPTRAQAKALEPFDPPTRGEFPAINVGGDFGFLNSGTTPAVLAHQTGLQIANSLANPQTTIARHLDGLANLFSAAICVATSQQPAAVCTSAGVLAAKQRL